MAKRQLQSTLPHPTLEIEKSLWNKGYKHIAGVDEAGRGPLAGPVVAAAVIFDQNTNKSFDSEHLINDSKKLSSAVRLQLYEKIKNNCLSWGLGEASAKEIDKVGISIASIQAMKRALKNLHVRSDYTLIDFFEIPGILCKGITKGDAKCFSIAAASIIAKVSRDIIMNKFDIQYPKYNFAQHKGYGTKYHIDKIKMLGPTTIHRKTFEPIKSLLIQNQKEE